ncbi:serine/threonine protein kinase [Candidatus Vecturithrix granuli]|uniref:non-specific serine/threonine protein kinase n=1 Tax=Vecturithrix granuli TaxID=1499967 RepID=A0A081BV19_VECG1|nr:serine/threonine protein kinase [Candidatus Vecturithrix granuli]
MKVEEIIQNRYQIQQLLGQGSMGITYKAFDLMHHRDVAIKQLHLAHIHRWKILDMFEREARILQQISHPRVPGYIDYFSQDGSEGLQFLLVQEYVEGKTLKQLIDEGWRGSEADILDIFLDIVDILVALHSVCPPVIHRDINPKNIIISPNTKVSPVIHDVYLVDFGAVQDKIRTTVFGGTTAVGTFGYVPFEQFSGQAVPASDYYALGATLLFMLTHRHPSEFPAEDFKPQFTSCLHASPAVIRLLDGLLEPSVKERVASLERIRDILDELITNPLESDGSAAKPVETPIEKIIEQPYHLSFRIPTQKIGIVVKRTVLSLSPKWIQLREELLGLQSGRLWRIPTINVQTADFTWYFAKGKRVGKGNSVLSINHAGETFEIASHLSKAEIGWLIREMTDFIWKVKYETESSDSEETSSQAPSTSSSEQLPTVSPPLDTRVRKFTKKSAQVCFRIPNTIMKTEMADFATIFLVCLACTSVFSAAAIYLFLNSQPGFLLGGLAGIVAAIFGTMGAGIFISGISRIFGRTMLYLTPEWIRISRRCFGVGYSQHIPTAALHPNDVIRYFQKNTLLLGLNYDGKTVRVGSGLSRQEIDWLIQEISAYITTYAKPLPRSLFEADLEMK